METDCAVQIQISFTIVALYIPTPPKHIIGCQLLQVDITPCSWMDIDIKITLFVKLTANGTITEIFEGQPNKMVKHTRTIRRKHPANCLSVFDHFEGLALKVLRGAFRTPSSIYDEVFFAKTLTSNNNFCSIK